MTPETLGYANLAGLVAVLAFLWTLHRDMRDIDRRIGALAERVAKLEGMVAEISRSIQSLREDVRHLYERERPAVGE